VNDILKQRLIGALILLALGVVFWPIIFVEPGDRPAAGEGRIPPRPAVDTTPIEPPDASGLRTSPELALATEPGQQVITEFSLEAEPAAETETDLEPAGALPVIEPETEPAAMPTEPPAKARRARSEAPGRPVLDSNGLPVAWILQVASVSSAAKADALRERLLEMDQKAYVKKVARGEKDLYRVYIGPRFERAPLEQLQAGIDTRFKVQSLIVRYIP